MIKFKTKSERDFWEKIYAAALQLSVGWELKQNEMGGITPVEIADHAVRLRRDRDDEL